MDVVFDKLRDLQDILSEKIELEKKILEIPKMLTTQAELLARMKKTFIEKNQEYEKSKSAEAEYRNHLADADVEFIHNHNFSQTQMFESVCLGLKEIHGRCERVLLTPADVPLVRVETVRALLEYNEAFVRPVYQNRGGHPVLITIDLIPKLLAYHGDGGLRRAVESCGTLINNVAVDDPGILLNCNTPEDYSCLKAM